MHKHPQKHTRDVIKSRLRYPGGQHEWLPVERADQIKRWGVAYADYAAWRAPMSEVVFTDPDAAHGEPGSARAHLEIVALMGASKSLGVYRKKLSRWADYRLVGGREALPEPLRSTDRKVSRERSIPKLSGRGHVIVWLGGDLSSAELDAYLVEAADDEDDSRPLSTLAADFGLPWYDHDLLERRSVDEPLDIETLLAPFSFARSFHDLVAEEMPGTSARHAVLLYDSPYAPLDDPPGAPLSCLGVFEYHHRAYQRV